ncbi:universal stress protein [Arthrobacter sp. S2(2024)]|uniref:universal stress protein n=1 Tax=Arthrobacter sp. S2(2024) TaxID=3111911 RepID=UPI002FC98ED6
MTNPIVVGADGSKTARKAAEIAHGLAVALNAPLLIISAFDSERAQVLEKGSDSWVLSAADDAEKAAKSVASSLLADRVDVSHSFVKGKPAEALVEEAARVDARLIVVGNRRMRGIGRLLGSVANSVAHNAS